MNNLPAMLQAIKFIETNLEKPIRVIDIANAVGYSLYHFSRTFCKITKHSPYDYLIRRRLSEAAQDLLEKDSKVIDLALTYQFNNPETFSRAFKKMFKIPPYQLKRCPTREDLVFKRKLTADYLKHINKGDFLWPQLVSSLPLHLMGMVIETEMNSLKLKTTWEKLKRQALSTKNRIIPEKYYSVAFNPMNWSLEGVRMLAFEVNSLEQIPCLLVGKSITVTKYAKFIHKGLANELGMTFDFIYQTWFPKSSTRISTPIAIEEFSLEYPDPDDPEAESNILIPLEDDFQS